jgi:cytochrome c553
MDAIQSGTKKGPKIMNAAFHELDEKEVEALLNYYASGPEGADEGPQS